MFRIVVFEFGFFATVSLLRSAHSGSPVGFSCDFTGVANNVAWGCSLLYLSVYITLYNLSDIFRFVSDCAVNHMRAIFSIASHLPFAGLLNASSVAVRIIPQPKD